ncbi:S41 family peptidase [Aquimarina pacifica]|uniref:S41 family peptidase n=1 Tax=Aquimarina pacifica TaxID=1296415 RepID=UPI00047102D4|nr:S41 family peptidase [Aquimarina pacifica]
MNKIQFIVLSFSFILHTTSAQKSMDSIHINQDFSIFENILKEAHPSLYEYCSEDSLNTAFYTTKESLGNGLSDIDLYKKMLKITSMVKDGHLQVFAPTSFKTDQYYFPLILKIINTEFYTDTEEFNIPLGSKITKINNKRTSKILEDLKKYVPSDGYNISKKYRGIESRFGQYFAYEYGINQKFTIEYIEPNGSKKNKELLAQSFTEVNLRNTKRSSYFYKYHKKEKGFDFFNSFINNKNPFVYYKKNLNTAVLVVNSFELDTQTFKSKLINIFNEIRKKKTQHLIIDIRRNDKGFRANAVQLYAYLSKNTFKQITSTFVASLSIPQREYAKRVFLNEKEFLKDKFNNHPIYDGWKLTFDDLETMMRANKNRFEGKVYVLTSGTTFSAASSFALNAKNDPDIILIGEETGGGYYCSNLGFPVYYEFPNSKITMIMSMEKMNFYTKEKSIPRGSGIIPDRKILMNINDLIDGKDRDLDYIFRLIKGE